MDCMGKLVSFPPFKNKNMDIEDKNYLKYVQNWIAKREDFNDTENLGESFCVFVVNYPGLKGLIVDVTKYKGRNAVLFYRKDSFFKIHFPKKIEWSYKEDERRRMTCIKTDKYWAYEEQLMYMATVNFGMDMTMPFLKEQNWEEIK